MFSATPSNERNLAKDAERESLGQSATSFLEYQVATLVIILLLVLYTINMTREHYTKYELVAQAISKGICEINHNSKERTVNP